MRHNGRKLQDTMIASPLWWFMGGEEEEVGKRGVCSLAPAACPCCGSAELETCIQTCIQTCSQKGAPRPGAEGKAGGVRRGEER